MKKLDKTLNILIIGLGLLGGSYAMSLKKQGYKVSAITKDQSTVDYALKNGIVDFATTDVDETLIKNSNLIIFALYPHIFKEWVKQYGNLISDGTVITDVTGVKGTVVYEIQSLLKDGVEFISAHPMAGREASGVENSSDEVFKGANYIVVPTEKNTENAKQLCRDLGYTLGFADISELTPQKHDEMIAFLSQLTHCIAVSLMCASDDPDLEHYTGDSFRDLTRIANINDEMWSELFLANKTALLKEMDSYRTAFDKLYNFIVTNDRDGMREMMKLSTARRKRFEKRI